MRKLTLLEIVQKVLSPMDSDLVNSIDETEEALQVAQIAHDTYEFIISKDDYKDFVKWSQLEGVADSKRPTVLRIPDDVLEVRGLKYKKLDIHGNEVFYDLSYLDPETFMDKSLELKQSYEYVQVSTLYDDVTFFIRNDRPPTYWTSFDNKYIVCDSYDSQEDTTLHEDNTRVWVVQTPKWEQSNEFVPELPLRLYPLYLAEVRTAAFAFLRQQSSPVDAKRSLELRNNSRNSYKRTAQVKRGRGYGRRR